jgi:hypothetical protein
MLLAGLRSPRTHRQITNRITLDEVGAAKYQTAEASTFGVGVTVSLHARIKLAATKNSQNMRAMAIVRSPSLRATSRNFSRLVPVFAAGVLPSSESGPVGRR